MRACAGTQLSMLPPYDPQAVCLGIDIGSLLVGVCVLRVVDFEPLAIMCLRVKRSTLETQLAALDQQVADVLPNVRQLGAPVAVALEHAADRFDDDRHDTPFALGQAFQQLWLAVAPLAVPRYKVTPAAASQAVSCARGASKITRNRACARILGIEDWNDRVGHWRGVRVNPDGLDAYAVACAGIGHFHTARLHALATDIRP